MMSNRQLAIGKALLLSNRNIFSFLVTFAHLPIAHCQLPIANCQLRIAHRPFKAHGDALLYPYVRGFFLELQYP